MEHEVSRAVEHIAASHTFLAQILEAKRDITVHLASLITSLADRHLSFSTKDDMYKNCTEMTVNVVSYLNSIGALEEALAENLTIVMQEINAAEQQSE